MTRAASLTSSVLSGKRNLVDFLWRRRGSGGRCIQDPDTVVKGPSPYVKVDSYWPTLVVSRYAVRGTVCTVLRIKKFSVHGPSVSIATHVGREADERRTPHTVNRLRPGRGMEHTITAPISALSYSRCGHYVLVGMAATLRVYIAQTGILLIQREVLERNEAIHGIHSAAGDIILVFGLLNARVLKLTGPSSCTLLASVRLPRRILCISLVSLFPSMQASRFLVLGCDNNSTILMPFEDGTLQNHHHTIGCSDAPLLYSMATQPTSLCSGDSQKTLLVASGSAFRHALLWDAAPEFPLVHGQSVRPPLRRLDGHEGAIFCVRFSPSGNYLISGSDDRRLILWRLPPLPDCVQGPNDVFPLGMKGEYAWFAHGARVWDAAFAAEERSPGGTTLTVASSGEDSTVRLWRMAPTSLGKRQADMDCSQPAEAVKLSATFRGHAGKHVWCVAAHKGQDARSPSLVSGGADGALKFWPIREHLTACSANSQLDEAQSNLTAGQKHSQCPDAPNGRQPSSPKSASRPNVVGGISIDGGSPIRALALLDLNHVVVATAGGDIWIVPLSPDSNDQAPATKARPSILFSRPGTRWSKLDSKRSQGAWVLLAGSATGEVLLSLMTRRRRHGDASTWHCDEAASWQAHRTCVMQNEWITCPAFVENGCALLATADATGQVAIWKVLHTQHVEDSAAIVEWSSTISCLCRPKLMPTSQRVSALAGVSRGEEPGDGHSSHLLFCGGSAGSVRVHIFDDIDATIQDASSKTGAMVCDSNAVEDVGLALQAHAGQPVTDIQLEFSSVACSDDNAVCEAARVATTVAYSCGRNGVINEIECSSRVRVTQSGESERVVNLVILRSWKCSEASVLEALLPMQSGLRATAPISFMA